MHLALCPGGGPHSPVKPPANNWRRKLKGRGQAPAGTRADGEAGEHFLTRLCKPIKGSVPWASALVAALNHQPYKPAALRAHSAIIYSFHFHSKTSKKPFAYFCNLFFSHLTFCF